MPEPETPIRQFQHGFYAVRDAGGRDWALKRDNLAPFHDNVSTIFAAVGTERMRGHYTIFLPIVDPKSTHTYEQLDDAAQALIADYITDKVIHGDS